MQSVARIPVHDSAGFAGAFRTRSADKSPRRSNFRNERFFPVEHNMEEKANLYIAEKTAIARYAASLLEEGDFVYLDAGTTTEKVIDFIPLKKSRL